MSKEYISLSFLTQIFDLLEKKLVKRNYTMLKALLTKSWIHFINKKGFVKRTFNKDFEMFIVYIVLLKYS